MAYTGFNQTNAAANTVFAEHVNHIVHSARGNYVLNPDGGGCLVTHLAGSNLTTTAKDIRVAAGTVFNNKVKRTINQTDIDLSPHFSGYSSGQERLLFIFVDSSGTLDVRQGDWATIGTALPPDYPAAEGVDVATEPDTTYSVVLAMITLTWNNPSVDSADIQDWRIGAIQGALFEGDLDMNSNDIANVASVSNGGSAVSIPSIDNDGSSIVIGDDLNISSNNLDNVASIDNGGSAIQINDSLDLNNNSLDDVNSIDGGGNEVSFPDGISTNTLTYTTAASSGNLNQQSQTTTAVSTTGTSVYYLNNAGNWTTSATALHTVFDAPTTQNTIEYALLQRSQIIVEVPNFNYGIDYQTTAGPGDQFSFQFKIFWDYSIDGGSSYTAGGTTPTVSTSVDRSFTSNPVTTNFSATSVTLDGSSITGDIYVRMKWQRIDTNSEVDGSEVFAFGGASTVITRYEFRLLI